MPTSTKRFMSAHVNANVFVMNFAHYTDVWLHGSIRCLGHCCFCMPPPYRYVGAFRNGEKTDVGVYFWPDGSQYQGNWDGNRWPCIPCIIAGLDMRHNEDQNIKGDTGNPSNRKHNSRPTYLVHSRNPIVYQVALRLPEDSSLGFRVGSCHWKRLRSGGPLGKHLELL